MKEQYFPLPQTLLIIKVFLLCSRSFNFLVNGDWRNWLCLQEINDEVVGDVWDFSDVIKVYYNIEESYLLDVISNV